MSNISKIKKEVRDSPPPASFWAYHKERKEEGQFFLDELSRMALRKRILVREKWEYDTETERVLKLLYPDYKPKLTGSKPPLRAITFSGGCLDKHSIPATLAISNESSHPKSTIETLEEMIRDSQ